MLTIPLSVTFRNNQFQLRLEHRYISPENTIYTNCIDWLFQFRMKYINHAADATLIHYIVNMQLPKLMRLLIIRTMIFLVKVPKLIIHFQIANGKNAFLYVFT